MKKSKEKLIAVLRALPLIISIAVIIVYIFSKDRLSVESILGYAPSEPILAALFLILFYTLKSLAVFFPIIVLYIAGGFLFEPFTAIIVNTAGLVCGFILEYFIGRMSGTKTAEKILKKYPKAERFISSGRQDGFFLSFFLRMISVLPCDLVSLYLGAVNIPFYKFLLGSISGSLPGLIMATLVGTSITDPKSPMFIISVTGTVIITLMSAAAYYLYTKKKNSRN